MDHAPNFVIHKPGTNYNRSLVFVTMVKIEYSAPKWRSDSCPISTRIYA